VAVFETHLQADHLSGLPALVAATGAEAYLPAGAEVAFGHQALSDGDEVALGNVVVKVLSTPGHAPAHAAYLVSDLRRGTAEPWLCFTGDALLVGDVGRPDLHAAGDPDGMARALHASLVRLMALPDHVLVYPSHYGGSLCGRALSGNPFSTIGFERRHNAALAHADPDAFARALLEDLPPAPEGQAAIVAANRAGDALAA
jgi:glyoxylase-like metal-dependent hydrolase (beta-lactamase superfamily II)